MNTPQLKYTLCFIRHADQCLMLNRFFSPNMGLWNGVGGKIEPGESPDAAILREVQEETALPVCDVTFSGIVTWRLEDRELGGMHVYLATLDGSQQPQHAPTLSEEGILAWHSVAWILDKENGGVVSNIPLFLPSMLRGEPPLCHAFSYRDDQIVGYETTQLER